MHRLVPVLLLAGAANAQWVYHRTQDVPRTKDGHLNRAAPTPRTRDGKPDFSGLWWPSGPQRPCTGLILGDDGDCIEKGLGTVLQGSSALPQMAINIGSGVQGGLPYQPWAADLVRERDKRAGVEDPHVRCLPSNLPRLYTLPHLQRIVHSTKLLVMLNEFNASYRQVYLDSRELPKDPAPAWNGYSVGHWEKDTLVIETIGFRDDLWLDMRGNPLTSAAKLTERIRRPNFGAMEIELTVDDPKAYTKPWTVLLHSVFVADTEMMDEICLEGEKSFQHMKDLR
jgi:hypothetical protein